MGVKEDYLDALALAKQGNYKQAEQKLARHKHHPKVQPLYNKIIEKLDAKKKKGINPIVLGLIVGLIAVGAIGVIFVVVVLPNQNASNGQEAVAVEPTTDDSEEVANNESPTEAIQATETPASTPTPLPAKTPMIDENGAPRNDIDIALISELLAGSTTLNLMGIQIIDGEVVFGERYIGIGVITDDDYGSIYVIAKIVGSYIKNNNLHFDGIIVQTSLDGQSQSIKAGMRLPDVLAYANGEISDAEFSLRMLIE